MSIVIGIDLGTTHSLGAVLGKSGPRIIPNALGEPLTPSVVGVDLDGQWLVGRGAKELQVTHPERCASLFKRHMGSAQKITIDGRELRPEELSSRVLASIKGDAEALIKRPIERAVITVPAYFNDDQRKATIHAGQIAGLQVERISNEPTAAALAYGFHEANEEKLILIFDLGGGTFDVSLVELFEGSIEVRATSGESFLGGEDFTRCLAARALEKHGFVFERAELEHPRLVSRAIQQAEQAKCALSQQNAASMRIPAKDGSLAESSPIVEVTRSQFEEWTRNILRRVEMPIRRVLGDARLQRQDIDEVILVGGATRMPMVIDLVTKIFGKEPQRRYDPDHVVALGAAVQAGLIANHKAVTELVVTDICPFTLGVEVSQKMGASRRDGYFLPIINRNTTIPVSRVERVSTVESNQTEIHVRIYQGESRRAEENLFLGDFRVDGIPRAPAGTQAVDLRFTYDLNGVLEVEAKVVSTGKVVSHVVTKHVRGMTPEEIAKSVKAMAKLKVHPRDEAVNRTLLRRAERVYQELSLEARSLLDDLLRGFEEAMELNDAAAMEQYRAVLEKFLGNVDISDSTEPADDGHP
ncbi:MAG: Hsp70 family protein [Planctomycetota bacterium]